jgi:hypothetical protein
MVPGQRRTIKHFTRTWTMRQALRNPWFGWGAKLLAARDEWWDKSDGNWWDELRYDRMQRTRLAMECPRLGVYGKDHTLCRQNRICPFCWARDIVGPLYDRALAVWTKDMRQLYAVCTAQRIDVWPMVDSRDPEELARVLDEAMPETPAAPHKDALWPNVRDAYHIVTFELAPEGLVRSSRCLYRSTQSPKQVRRVATTHEYAAPDTNAAIATAIAQVGVWPNRHLADGGCKRMITLHRALQRLGSRKLRSGYGAFRR